jgi:acetyltransferase
MLDVDLGAEPQRQLPPSGGSVDWLPQLGALEIRPLSPADHPAYCAFAAKLGHDDLRLRFAGLIKIDCDVLRAQLIALDHTQSEALAGFAGGEMLAIAHLVRTAPDTAEFALIVRSDLKRRGLGRVMIARLVEQACRLGLRVLTAEILTENMPMLRLAREAGFHATGRSGLFIDMARETGCADGTKTLPTNPA